VGDVAAAQLLAVSPFDFPPELFDDGWGVDGTGALVVGRRVRLRRDVNQDSGLTAVGTLKQGDRGPGVCSDVGWFRTNGHENGDGDHAMKLHGLVRKAVNARLTCPADVSSAERSLIVASGPPEELSRKGLQHARQWLESKTESAEILAGDDPRRDADRLAVAILLSNVTDMPRVDALQEQAVDAQATIESQEDSREQEVTDLVTDENDQLDPL
jgi:cell division GTPase FtsZ